MMNDSERSKLYLIGLRYSQENKKIEFKNEFDFIKTVYLESVNFNIGNNIDSLKEYPKCKINEMETGDIAIYKSSSKLLIGINYGSVLERVLMYYDEDERKVKMTELYENIEEYKFQYGIKLNKERILDNG